MNYTVRSQELVSQYLLGKSFSLKGSSVAIRHTRFKSKADYRSLPKKQQQSLLFKQKKENKKFLYPVFMPTKAKKLDQAILLLHGLNERNWNKYLSWAEYLCEHSGKAVILFPIANHINRSPEAWSNPRKLSDLLNIRRAELNNDRTLSFANLALSERLTSYPEFFYESGRQSFDDIMQLMRQIKRGKHPLFMKYSQVDIFAYSIGAFLAQVLFLANPQHYFSNSRLFMFCGGSVFNAMQGTSKSIMNRLSFDTLFKYYQSGKWANKQNADSEDLILSSFYSMLTQENAENSRLSKFNKMLQQIKGISLKADKVIPYEGVIKAFGNHNASQCFELWDFPYPYAHENPFPINKNINPKDVDSSFQKVFDTALEFLVG